MAGGGLTNGAAYSLPPTGSMEGVQREFGRAVGAKLAPSSIATDANEIDCGLSLECSRFDHGRTTHGLVPRYSGAGEPLASHADR